MGKDILVEPYVDSIVMPENLKVGLMVSEQREKCRLNGCRAEYYGFAFGQSPFFVPEPLSRALSENASKGHYSAAEGVTELRRAVADFNRRHFQLDVDPDRVIIGPGTKHLIDIVFTIVRGDVIIPSPSWIGYSPQVRLLDKHFHTFYLEPEFNYKIQPGELDKYLGEIHKEQHILVLNNPHNPTGALYRKEELEVIADVCRKHHTLVLADEIYALTTYKIEDFTSMGLVYPEGTFVTNGLSKDRSAGGFRLGSCILPEACSRKLKEDFKKVAAAVYTNVSTPTQYAAIIAYEPHAEIDAYFRVTRDIHRMMGQYTSMEFNKIESIQATVPEGAFYFFADFNILADDLKEKGVVNSNELGRSLLSHPHHITAVTGDACLLEPDDFGARIAFVDYDGKEAYENYVKNPPDTVSEEIAFVKKNAPKMVRGIEALGNYVDSMRKK